MDEFIKSALSTCSYMFARFLSGKDYVDMGNPNDSVHSHFAEEISYLLDKASEKTVSFQLFADLFVNEVIEGEYEPIIESLKNKAFGKLVAEFFEYEYEGEEYIEKVIQETFNKRKEEVEC